MNQQQMIDKLPDGPEPSRKLVSLGWNDATAHTNYALVQWDAYSSRPDGKMGRWLVQFQGDYEWAKRQAKHRNIKIEKIDG